MSTGWMVISPMGTLRTTKRSKRSSDTISARRKDTIAAVDDFLRACSESVFGEAICMSIAISMVMSTSDAPIKVADVQHELSAKWPDLPAATDVKQENDD